MESPTSSVTLWTESVHDDFPIENGQADFPGEVSEASESPLPEHVSQSRQSRPKITSALMEAIRFRLEDSVSMLLEDGANPNGIPLHVMEKYAAFFLRFRHKAQKGEFYAQFPIRNDLLNHITLPQLSTLTNEEIEDRMYDGMAPFWCEEGFVKADFFRHGESMPSLVEASRSGSISILNQLIDAKADASFWMRPQFFIPNPPTESSLSISSLIHAALQSRDLTMLKHLLNLGFDPNTMPLANPTRCITPAMATIIYSTEFNCEAFDLLSDCPNINMELRTPVYRVHLLHFAVAGMDINVVKHVESATRLRNAGTTSLGHTLLHIACMPPNAISVQRHSLPCFRSINETRSLHAQNDYGSYPTDADSYVDFPSSIIWDALDENDSQTMVFKYLWDNGITDIEKKDVHGNTCLHYLAGSRVLNHDLLDWLLDEPGDKMTWQNSKNKYQYTPEELYNAGLKEARSNSTMGWRFWFAKPLAEARRERKEAIWENLLG